MDDDPTAGNTNRTIQVDALADVELLDQDSESLEADAQPASPGLPPPPLPHRKPNLIIIGVVVLLAGGLGAVGAFMIPSAEPVVAAPPAAPAAPPPLEEAPAEAGEIRHVPLGDEFIIRFDDDAGLPPSE